MYLFRAIAPVALMVVIAACGDTATPESVAAPDAPPSTLRDSETEPEAEPADAAPIDDGEAVDCEGGLVIDGTFYVADWENRGKVPTERLGAVVGEVTGSWRCTDSIADLGAGIFASEGIPGTEIRAIEGRSPDDVVAIATPAGVELYRRPGELSVAGALAAGSIAIGINSEFDGTTRFATIDDPATIETLLQVARTAEATADLSELSTSSRYFIEFEHPDGLSTTVPYVIHNAQLWDRIVGAVWADAIDAALAASPPAPVFDGITLTHGGAEIAIRPLGSCRLGSVDAMVEPGDALTADVGPDLDAAELQWWFNPPNGVGELLPESSFSGPSIDVPAFDGAVIVELYLSTGPGRSLEACAVLASSP